MESIESLIQRCHARREVTLEQAQTEVLPALFKEYPYHYRVHYALGASAYLYELEQADISVIPIGRVPEDRAPREWFRKDRYVDRINNKQGSRNWRPKRWYVSYGVGIYTGETSGHDGANWHDIEFTYQAISRVPEAVSMCLEALIGSVANPLVTLTKAGGLRFSCRIPDYLHPNTSEAKQYIYADNGERDVFVEVKGALDYSVWDARYEILTGSVLEPPVIEGPALFAMLDFFKGLLHKPAFSVEDTETTVPQAFDSRKPIRVLNVEDTPVDASEKLQAIRDGELSPLAIKRPGPVLTKRPYSEPEPFEIAEIMETDARVIGIQTGLRHPDENRAIESELKKHGTVFINVATEEQAAAVIQYHGNEGITVLKWKGRAFLASMLQSVPIEELHKDPFKHGNMCIDSRRCNRLTLRGGHPITMICPKCPVYEVCQEQGYLFQKKNIIFEEVGVECDIQQGLMNPDHYLHSKSHLKDDTIYVMGYFYASDLFIENKISLRQFRAWTKNWKGAVLGNFAQAMLNAINVNREDLTDNISKRVRVVVEAFEGASETIIEQMYQVNVAESGETPRGMELEAAVEAGFFSIETVQDMNQIPVSAHYKEWTYWHKLQRFFAHYARDADAPMRFDDSNLRFWIPPVLSESVKKVVVLSPTIHKSHLQRAFPNEKVEVYDLGTKETLAGNQIYQLRGDIHFDNEILNFDLDWDMLGLSNIGIRFSTAVNAEAKRTPKTQHRLIIPIPVGDVLADMLKYPNVAGTCHYKYVPQHEHIISEIGTSDVIWISNMPYFPPALLWHQAKILYGNDAEPLDYTVSMQPYIHKDSRLQSLHEQYSAYSMKGMLTYAGWAEGGKTVVLNSGLYISDFTDAPETTLFDWEDLEIAGSLDGLSLAIQEREAYQAEVKSIDGTWTPERVEFLLGVSRSQAERIISRHHGGYKGLDRIDKQILDLLADGREWKVKEIVSAVIAKPGSVKNNLIQLAKDDEIIRVRHGVYRVK